MEGLNIGAKAQGFIKKYKYIIFIALVGVVLMLLPQDKKQDAQPTQTQTVEAQPSLQAQLEQLLSCVEGAGRVKVFLTTRAGEERIYQTDTDITENETGQSARTQTVILTDEDRNQTGMLQKTLSPIYRGAIIVCQGGGDPAVRLMIVEAVAKATGLGSNEIAVLKMN